MDEILNTYSLENEVFFPKIQIKLPFRRIYHSRFARRLLTCCLALLVLVPGILIFFQPTKASAAWFDDNYAYRQKISFTHNADITSDRRVTITADTATLITNGKMQSNCADTRFTDINGKVLRYQLTGTCNNSATTYDVIFPAIYNGSNSSYVYYGNPNAASASQVVSSVTGLSPSGGSPTVTAEEKGPTPVLSWKFDEGYGTTANDTTINANNGTLTNGPTWQAEDLCLFGGKCLRFDGTNQNVQKTYSSDKELDPGTASMSASLWYKHPNTISATQYLVSRYTTSAPAGGYKIYMKSTGIVCFGIDDDSTWNPDDEVCDTASTADSKWHNVQVVKSEGSLSITIYIDGKQVAQKNNLAATASISGNSPTFYVGIDSDGASSPWNGFIDEVKIYQFAKTASDIKAMYANRGSTEQISASFGAGDPAYSLSQGLAAYWKMDDGVNNPCASGVDKACDSSGNGNVATWKNGVASTSGKFANATNYDGTDDYFEESSVSGTNKNEETVSAWIRPTTVTGNHVVIDLGHGSFSVQDDLLIRQSGTNISFRLWDGNSYQDITASGVLAVNTWTHVVALHSVANSRSEFYVNGELIGTMNTYKDSSNNHSFINIGRDFQWLFPTDYFQGQIDDVRIYNRPLAPAEVRSIYDWAPGPVGWWKLDEHTGTSANDSSGNANTGTLTNGPVWTTGKVGQGLLFDGVDDYINLNGQSASTFVTASTKTISVWIKPTGASPSRSNVYNLEAVVADNGQNFGIFRGTISGSDNIWAYNWDGNEDRVGVTYNPNEWTHIVYVHTGGNLYIYKNGVLGGSIASGDTTNLSATMYVGFANASADPDSNFEGSIDDVRIYNYARTSKQIIQDQ